jgi:bifunctional NMN adenylyltransferase/nudix hydrolase
MKKFDILVYIGRFQPVHNAHAEIIRRAHSLAEKVIIIVGSGWQPPTYKNPWSSAERHLMLANVIKDITNDPKKIVAEHTFDTIYNDDAWASRIQNIVNKHTNVFVANSSTPKIGIIGHDKDESTFYLKMFPQWERVEVELIEPLNATDIRDIYFREGMNLKFLEGVVPATTKCFLESFAKSSNYKQIIAERKFIEDYKKQFSGLAYPPIFVTVDAIVIQSGHVLMVRRRSEPGKGLWALPGGFVNANTDRSVQDAMIRELREETGIKVPAPVLMGSIKETRVFDAIARSTRGRTITHAFKIHLPAGDLPRVKGSDDAEKASWVPIANIDSSFCYEDHYEIIQWAVGG